MPWCAVEGCRNNLKATKRAGKNVSYHIFPKNPQRRNAWLQVIKRTTKFNVNSSYVCSEHFVPDDFECNSLKEELLNIKIKKQLKKTAIPSININYSTPKLITLDNENSTFLVDKSKNDIFMSETISDIYVKCCVVNCNSIYDAEVQEYNENILFHSFPNETEVSEKWLSFCNLPKQFLLDNPNAKICSKHFETNDYSDNNSELMYPANRLLKKFAIPSLVNEKQKSVSTKNEQDLRLERKKIVDKLLADYDEQKNITKIDNSLYSKYADYFSTNIIPNAKLGDKLKLIKAKDQAGTCYTSCRKRKKFKEPININLTNTQLPNVVIQSPKLNNEHVIHVSTVQGGLMLQAIPQPEPVIKQAKISHQLEKDLPELEEEIIIVTEDEANRVDLSSYSQLHKENSAEVVIVTDLKDTDNIPKTSVISQNYNNALIQNALPNPVKELINPLPQTQVSFQQEKCCQVLIPCKGCELRSFKINKLLRERAKMLKDLNQSSTWKDPDEIENLKKMNGVLSILLMQSLGDKINKKSSAIRVDLVQDTIERVDRGWSMQDTSEILSQLMSANAYDEFARAFEFINEV